MNRRLAIFNWITITLLFMFALNSLAESPILIDVGKAKIKKSLLAFPDLRNFGSKKDRRLKIKLGQEIYSTIRNDLTVSNYFTFIKPEAFLEDTSKVGIRPAPGSPTGFDFSKWKTIGTDFLIRGGYKIIGNKVNLEIYVYYVPQAKLVLGKSYEGPTQTLRKLAHTFSNDMIKKLTGKRGFFNTKIVVASNRGNRRHKEIFVMDWDSFNPQKITNHRSISISPAWSPDGRKIAYTAFAQHKSTKTRNADLFIFDLFAKKRWLVSYRKGINSGAAFMPDGQNLLMTMSRGRTPDIYKIDLQGRVKKRLTNGPRGALNVEPAITADGSKIAFSSNRGGQPMIFIMSSRGGAAKRVTFAGRYNASPSWSPDGTKLAFAGYDDNHFDIFVMDASGHNIVRLTSSRKKNGKWADNEDPTFSPDGRHIMFVSNRTGNHQLYVTDLEGSIEHRITTDKYNYYKPKWSPFLD